jgi:nucleoside-diphosphate-sugar epimerase
LLTGATGFVGSHLLRHLVDSKWDVHILRRPSSRAISAEISNIPVYEHGGSTSDLIDVFQQIRPDVVFHLAALVRSDNSADDVEPLVRSNVLLTAQLAEAAANAGTRGFVNTGSFWQHFGNSTYDPVNLYAATKQAAEDILRAFTCAGGLHAITLVLFDTYGPLDPRRKLFTFLRESAASGDTLDMSPGDQFVELVHVDDVASAFLLAADRVSKGLSQQYERFKVDSGLPRRLKDVVGLYARLSPRPPHINWGGRPYREREIMQPWSAGTRLPGWAPRIDLESGISQLLSSESAAANRL